MAEVISYPEIREVSKGVFSWSYLEPGEAICEVCGARVWLEYTPSYCEACGAAYDSGGGRMSGLEGRCYPVDETGETWADVNVGQALA